MGQNMLAVVGADASNAFIETPAPTKTLYINVDSQFHTWWNSLGRTLIPEGHGFKVHKALQGRLESPRLWVESVN